MVVVVTMVGTMVGTMVMTIVLTIVMTMVTMVMFRVTFLVMAAGDLAVFPNDVHRQRRLGKMCVECAKHAENI